MDKKTKVLSLCDKCKCCPQARRVNNKIVITEDNRPKGKTREIRLTTEQFQTLLEHGHTLLD